MTYRIQADLSFITQADADAFVAHIKSLGDKIYYPTLSELAETNMELWTKNRLCLIRDYDDEGNMVGGTSDDNLVILKPVDLEKSVSFEEKIVEVEKIVYKDLSEQPLEI